MTLLCFAVDEPDTPASVTEGGVGEGVEGEGGREGGTQPKEFNQVMLQAQNRMVLIAVLSDQKEKVGRRVSGPQSSTLLCVFVCVCAADM